MKLEEAAGLIAERILEMSGIPEGKIREVKPQAEEYLKKTLSTRFRKAAKWDKLKAEIEPFYPENEEEAAGDLCDIGEIAASAFGFMYGPLPKWDKIEY